MRNIVIPMAGKGSRFVQAGYKDPKPLIRLKDGLPMIRSVIGNVDLNGHYVFLTLQEHIDKFNLDRKLPDMVKDYNQYKNMSTAHGTVVPVNVVTEGACCTVLLAQSVLDLEDELLIVNSDQLVDWDPEHFLEYMNFRKADAGILTFKASETKWSYAKEENGVVSEVAEKNPISNNATVGIYWFKKAKYFVEGAKQMIEKNIRTNNEFYVCPVFNEVIANKLKVVAYPVKRMHSLGTPEDLEIFLKLDLPVGVTGRIRQQV